MSNIQGTGSERAAGGRSLTKALKGSSVFTAVGTSLAALAMLGGTAVAADLPSTVSPPAPPAPYFTGPLAPIFAPLAAQGFTFSAFVLDFFGDNPSIGLQRGRGSNDGYIVEGVDIDLGKVANISNTTIHYRNIFFAGVLNQNAAPQIGDAQIGFPPPYTPELARLAKLTIENKSADGKLDIEAGITHPGFYVAKFNSGTYNASFNDVLYREAGYESYNFSVPGGNINYAISPTLYVDAGAFLVQPNANKYSGYDFYREKFDGVLAVGEIGSQTSLKTDPYAYKVAVTGLFNTGVHTTYTNPFITGTKTGSGDIVLQGEKVIWHPAGTPTNLKIYGSYAAALDSTQPIQSDAWIGLTLSAPFLSRPLDYYGVKAYWEKSNPGFVSYENAGLNAGIPGYSSNAYTFEASAHFALPLGAEFEPVFDYTVNPNNYWNGQSPTKVHDGVYLGGTVFIPIGVILGIQAPS